MCFFFFWVGNGCFDFSFFGSCLFAHNFVFFYSMVMAVFSLLSVRKISRKLKEYYRILFSDFLQVKFYMLFGMLIVS